MEVQILSRAHDRKYNFEEARLAQLVEHILDVNGVIGSSPIPPTNKFIYLGQDEKAGAMRRSEDRRREVGP